MNKKIIITILLALIAMAVQAQTNTSALLRGRIVNVPKEFEDRLSLHYYDPLQTISSNDVPLQLDSLGRFEVEVPLMDTAPVAIVWIVLLLSPGETYDVEMDGATGSVVVKGRDAALTNEVIQHQPMACIWDMEAMKDEPDAFVMDAAKKEQKRLEAANDSIQKVFGLSKQWRDYARYRIMSTLAYYLVQRRFVDATVRQSADGKLWQWLHDNFIYQMPCPFTLIQDHLGYIIMNYAMELVSPRSPRDSTCVASTPPSASRWNSRPTAPSGAVKPLPTAFARSARCSTNIKLLPMQVLLTPY